MQFKDLLVLLRSQEGTAIGELELGSPASNFTFDEVAADIRHMMPSSQYNYESSSGNQSESMSDVEGNYSSSSPGGVNDLELTGMFSPLRRYFKK
jgi:hypothetical protein